MKVKKLDHVVIATQDLEDALRLWDRNVGLKPDASLDKPLGSGFKVARLPIGDSFLELVQPVEASGRFFEQVQERGEGLFSISVQVEDLDDAVSTSREEHQGFRPGGEHLARRPPRPHQPRIYARRLHPAHRAQVGRSGAPAACGSARRIRVLGAMWAVPPGLPNAATGISSPQARRRRS